MIRKTTACALLTTALASGSAGLCMAHEQGDWVVKAGAGSVRPNDDSTQIDTSALGKLDSEVSVNNDTSFVFTVGYMITDNWAVSLLAATPFEHDIEGNGGILDGVGIGSTKHLPPTLTLQYYFLPGSNVRPYAGIGVNFTKFFDEDEDGDISKVNPDWEFSGLDLDDSWGFAAEVGVDWTFHKRWFATAALWYIDLDTEADLEIRSKSTGEKVSDVRVNSVEVDPFVYMFSVGTTF
jgi:outer membrane protein